ncbi:MAG: TolC family protein [Planctomycetota bacterium]
MKRTAALSIALSGLLGTTACNLLDPELGAASLPYPSARTKQLEQLNLRESDSAERRTLDTSRIATKREPASEATGEAATGEVSPPSEALSIDVFRELVLQRNLDLEVARIDPSIASAKVESELGKFDAVIGARVRYSRRESPPIDGPLAKLSSTDPALDDRIVKLTEVEQRKATLDLGLDLSVPLPTGGVIGIGTGAGQKNLEEPQLFEQYLAATRFSFSQPLLRGAGPAAALAPLRIARIDQRRSEVAAKLSALRVLAGAEKAYWRLYAARRFLDVREEQYRLATERLALVQERVAQGVAPTVEIQRTEVGVYQRLEALIIAKTEHELRKRELRTWLGDTDLHAEPSLVLDPKTEPRLVPLDLDRKRLVESALEQRLDLIEFELALVRDAQEIGLRENEALPIANLDFKYGILERDDSLADAWRSQWDLDHRGFEAGLSMAMPLTNQQRRARLDEAVLSRARRLAAKSARELAVRREVLDAADVLEQNWLRILAARQNVLVAGVNLDAEQQQFDQGLRTMREVLEALSDVGDAQMREVRAIVDYQVAQIDLAFAAGVLLGYSGVELEPILWESRLDSGDGAKN